MPVSFLSGWSTKMKIKSKLVRCFIAEIVCTMIFLYGGFAASAQWKLSNGTINGYSGMSFAWGMALAIAAFIGGNISGAHMNPAVSLFVTLNGKLSALYFAIYVIAQCIGAFVAAAITFIHYYDMINAFDGGKRMVKGVTATAGIFATFPKSQVSFAGAFIDQMFATAFFCLAIGAITDSKNKVAKYAQPLLIGMSFTFICLTFGLISGNAINPARDLMPRLFLFIAGYSWDVFSVWDHKFWFIPVICPLIGAVIAAWLYSMVIRPNIEEEEDTIPLFRINSVLSENSQNGQHKLTVPIGSK